MTDSRLKAKGKQDGADICRHRSILLIQPNRNQPDHEGEATRMQGGGQLGRNRALWDVQMQLEEAGPQNQTGSPVSGRPRGGFVIKAICQRRH